MTTSTPRLERRFELRAEVASLRFTAVAAMCVTAGVFAEFFAWGQA